MSTSLYECGNRPGTTGDKRAAEGMCDDCEALLTQSRTVCIDCCDHECEGDEDDQCGWCGMPNHIAHVGSFAGMARYDSSKGN